MLNLKVEKLQATIMQQQQEIETLTTQLEKQATQLQEASAQLEVNQPAAKAVVNKH
jgi:cell division protein FtsL